MVKVVFVARLLQSGLKAEVLKGETNLKILSTRCRETECLVVHLNDVDYISSSQHIWVKLDVCCFGCQGNRGTNDPFGCAEFRLNIVGTGRTRHSRYLSTK